MIDNSVPGDFGQGNSAVLVGDDGLLLVDGDALPDPRSIIAGLQSMFNRPIRYVIETACGGLAALSPKVDTIVAVDKVRKRVEQKKCWRGYPMVLPTGKTDGDAMVYFKTANVVVTGDAFISSALPSCTNFEGGNMLGLAAELRRIVALAPEDAKVIPGHGPLSSISDIRRASNALDEIRDVVAAQMNKGKTLDQLQQMNLLLPWQALIGKTGPQTPPYVKSFYDRLKGPPEPEFQLSPKSDKPY